VSKEMLLWNCIEKSRLIKIETLIFVTLFLPVVKSTFSETRLVPALNDLLIANPSPAAVSRFRMGWLEPVDVSNYAPLKDGTSMVSRAPVQTQYGTVTRFGGMTYDVQKSRNVWSSGMWVCTSTGSSAAMAAAGGLAMSVDSKDLQYLIREHMIEGTEKGRSTKGLDNKFVNRDEQLHLRWNSQNGRVFIDGPHITHDLELGDEILINSKSPPLYLFMR